MSIDRILELLNIELQCIQSDCSRECFTCPLVQEQAELEEMYKTVIDVLSDRNNFKANRLNIKMVQTCSRP